LHLGAKAAEQRRGRDEARRIAINIATKLMSHGLGRIERAILGLIEDVNACEARYAAGNLALAVYQPKGPKRRPVQADVTVLRAVRSLTRKFPDHVDWRQGS
jgi:hypothetical protein